MRERVTALAERFEQANRELVATIEGCSEAQWRRQTGGEGWTAGVVAHHVAEGHQAIAGLAQLVATGQPVPPLTMEMIDRGNAEHAAQHAGCTKAEVLRLLKANAASAAAILRGLTDAQFAHSASLLDQPMTAAQVVEKILIGHVQGHHQSIRAAIAG